MFALRARRVVCGPRAPPADLVVVVDARAGTIAAVQPPDAPLPPGAALTDLGDAALLPGAVDVFAQPPPGRPLEAEARLAARGGITALAAETDERVAGVLPLQALPADGAEPPRPGTVALVGRLAPRCGGAGPWLSEEQFVRAAERARLPVLVPCEMHDAQTLRAASPDRLVPLAERAAAAERPRRVRLHPSRNPHNSSSEDSDPEDPVDDDVIAQIVRAELAGYAGAGATSVVAPRPPVDGPGAWAEVAGGVVAGGDAGGHAARDPPRGRRPPPISVGPRHDAARNLDQERVLVRHYGLYLRRHPESAQTEAARVAARCPRAVLVGVGAAEALPGCVDVAHLLLGAADVPDGGTHLKTRPLLRDRAALRAALLDGDCGVLALSAGHAPPPDPALKLPERGDWRLAVAGLDTAGAALPAAWTAVRAAGGSLADLVRLTSAAPAALLGLGARKGGIREGMDADLVAFAPAGGSELRLGELALELEGEVERVWRGGVEVVGGGVAGRS